MQSKIRVLTDHTINKIAAGEVIENPASVVKELVENSIDAGANCITVEIRQGGRELIRISDNGSGMSPDDAVLCLERHATSKIHAVEDIQNLLTMGFRGEALPSIASISKFSILTSNDLQAATFVLVDGGRLISAAPAARARGTTIEVKSLFFNVPVRRKFQKSPTYDTQAILKIMSMLALSHPSIQFELISDQQAILKTSLAQSDSLEDNLAKRVEEILGKEFTKGFLPLHFESEPFLVHGFIGSPASHKPNRSNQHLFINRRAVYSPLISAVIREAYGPMLPSQRFPLFVLHLQLPGHLVDVNVHPQKKEVRLRQEQQLKEILIKSVQNALQRNPTPIFSPSLISLEKDEEYIPPAFAFPQKLKVEESKWEYKPNFNTIESPPIHQKEKTEIQTPLFAYPVDHPKVLLTLKGYLIIEASSSQLSALTKDQLGGLCLIDQKAAFARIYYERLLKKASSECELQPLLIPLTLKFPAEEARQLQLHLEQLNRMGFVLREFGEHTFLMEAHPHFLKQEDLINCLNQIVEDLMEIQESKKLDQMREERIALLACRAALPVSKRLSMDEAEGLLSQLFQCQDIFQCPFGKPTIAYWPPEQIPTLFKQHS